MVLMIDNYDSFTYNLVQYLGELNADVEVFRNDEITLDAIAAKKPERIVISPGPCTPNEAGISLELIQRFGDASPATPILGVCLGHQALAQACGGEIVHARTVMHGKTSMIHHNGEGMYKNLSNPFRATRYHSLVVNAASVPECLEVTAWTQTEDGARDEIMGLRHKTAPMVGVQFHPESILSDYGHELLAAFLGDEF